MLSDTQKSLCFSACSAGLICLLIFYRALWCGFINLDDDFYVFNNPLMQGVDYKTLKLLFSEPQQGAWLPLTIISFAIDNLFWSGNPSGYHLTNILLHAVNAMLVVLLTDSLFQHLGGTFRSIRGDRYLYPAMLLLAGLLFGIHPMRVESVVWVSERKDVLNGLFTFSSVLLYLRYVRKKSLHGQTRTAAYAYCLSVVLFLLSLMSKQASVVLPVILLVIDWYPLKRVGRENLLLILIEKLPYLLLSLALSSITLLWASRGNMMIAADEFPLYARCLVSGNDVFEYCRYLLYPVGIVPFYPIGDTVQPSFIVKTAIVVTFTAFCLFNARKQPFLAAIWFSFLIPLLPVLAFTQSSDDTAIASRYSYLPSVAPSIAAGILLAVCCQTALGLRSKLARIIIPSMIVLIVLCHAAITSRLISAWMNTGTLWTRQIEIKPLGRAYVYRGRYLYAAGRYEEALRDFSEAIHAAQQAGREDVFNIYVYHGEALRALGLHEEAIRDFTAAINLSPYPEYYYLRGCSLKAMGRLTEAEDDFRRAAGHTGPIPWYPEKFR
jgi:hypothetical protein